MGLNCWLTAVTCREYFPVGSATASLLSTVTAVSQQPKQSELGRVFRVVKRASVHDWLADSPRHPEDQRDEGSLDGWQRA